jgi:hypothetical protein
MLNIVNQIRTYHISKRGRPFPIGFAALQHPGPKPTPTSPGKPLGCIDPKTLLMFFGRWSTQDMEAGAYLGKKSLVKISSSVVG